MARKSISLSCCHKEITLCAKYLYLDAAKSKEMYLCRSKIKRKTIKMKRKKLLCKKRNSAKVTIKHELKLSINE